MATTRSGPRRSKAEFTAEHSRQAVMRAAERCIERHGIRKTTMDDIAREAGISRPSIYRFFADREELLVALTEEHSRMLTAKAHKFLARQPTFEDALVEGLLYIADHGNRDPFTRYLVAPDEDGFAMRIGATGIPELPGEYRGGVDHSPAVLPGAFVGEGAVCHAVQADQRLHAPSDGPVLPMV